MAERLVFHDSIVYEADKRGSGGTLKKAIKQALGITENPSSLADQVASALIGSEDRPPSRVGSAIQSALIGGTPSGDKQKQGPSSLSQQSVVSVSKEPNKPGIVQTYAQHVVKEVRRVLNGNVSALGDVYGRTIGDQIWRTLIPEEKSNNQAPVVRDMPNQPERSTIVPALPPGKEKK